MSKKILNFFLVISGAIIFSAFFLTTCQKDVNSYEVRLDNFKALLNEKMIEKFETGELDEVSNFLAEENQKNEEFQKKLLSIKTFESIEFFNEQQVVNYFYDYFYKKKQF